MGHWAARTARFPGPELSHQLAGMGDRAGYLRSAAEVLLELLGGDVVGWNAVDLPTGTEMKDVYRRLHDLQREVHALKRELRQQAKGAGGGGKRRGTAAGEAPTPKGQGDG